jgi:hypothetical protein
MGIYPNGGWTITLEGTNGQTYVHDVEYELGARQFVNADNHSQIIYEVEHNVWKQFRKELRDLKTYAQSTD